MVRSRDRNRVKDAWLQEITKTLGNIGTMQERVTRVRILKTKKVRVCAFEQLSRPTERVFEVVKGPHTRGVLGERSPTPRPNCRSKLPSNQ